MGRTQFLLAEIEGNGKISDKIYSRVFPLASNDKKYEVHPKCFLSDVF